MAALQALGSGLAGALALTAVHETVRRQRSDAPRMDLLGMQAIAKLLRAGSITPPSPAQLHELALGGDLVSNTLYYSLVARGRPETALARGALLGLAAGLGALALPKPMGLSNMPSNRHRSTQLMTVAWYLLGGLAAGATYQALARR
jgi:hypothetical protein